MLFCRENRLFGCCRCDAEQSINRIKTFTKGFDESSYDEALYAEETAKTIGTERYCVKLPLSKSRKYIEDIPYYYDEPWQIHYKLQHFCLVKLQRNMLQLFYQEMEVMRFFVDIISILTYIRYPQLGMMGKLINGQVNN